MSTLDNNHAPGTKPKPQAPPRPELEEDEEDIEEVDQTPHFDFFKEYYAAASAKKSVRQLPALVKRAMRMVWSASPFHFVFSTILQLLAAAGAGAQLLLGKDALGSLLAADELGAGFGAVLPKLLALSAVTAGIRITTTLQSYSQGILRRKVGREAMDQILDVATAVDLAAFESPEFYDRMQRAQMNSQMRPYQLISGLLGMVGATLGMAAIALAMFKIQPLIGPLVVAAYAPVWLVKRRSAKDFYKFHAEKTQSQRESRYISSVLTGREEAKEVRAFDLTKPLRRRYDDLLDEYHGGQHRLERKRAAKSLAANMFTILLMAGVMGLLISMVLTGRMELESAGAAIGAVMMLSTRVDGFLGSAEGLYETTLFLDDWASFLELKPVVEAARPTGPAPDAFRRLSVEGVGFAYPNSQKAALKNVSLRINAGEIVALVGENGSGKTTLAKLLAGLYLPTAGAIAWDGQDTALMDPVALRRSIALIFQDFVKYKLPARQNIGMGRHEQIDNIEAITQSAKQSGADRFLKHLPLGYETVLSKEFDGGRDLSVGQWQRVALARAFFRDAPFIILDEPTAALDPRAEKALFDNIRSLAQGRSVLLISHRFSSVRSADRTYVLKNGEVIENGTHSELMAMEGLYAELFTMQASAYLDPADA